ncbi:MAG TPA: hypothetical protein VGF59_05310 [Bryobacteraceae bacterium]|jgi:hypothetical protein
MLKNMIRVTALALGGLALTATAAYATDYRSENVNIPFDFKVEGKSLPAGVYRTSETFGSGIITLVNTETGQRVTVLRAAARRSPGRVRLVFQSGQEGYRLKVVE